MKQVLYLGLLALMMSCNDGDLSIETIDFDSVDIRTCESAVTTQSSVFFKINDDETLILTLQSGVLRNEVSESEIESNVPGQSQLTYRIFSDQVSNDYFCDAIPPIEPMVVEEINAESGSVFVNTVALDSVTFEHTIRLDNVSFVTGTDVRITDLRINEFGTVTTQ